jgi:hypothetical protein
MGIGKLKWVVMYEVINKKEKGCEGDIVRKV